jgi:C4-dicarboxylate-specific signal transduction histidine kinase
VPRDSNEVISEAILLIQSELENWQVSVQTRLMEGLPRVAADKVQLQQVILNLLEDG